MPNTEHRTTEAEIKEVWERLTSGEASIKSAHHRIDKLEKIADSMHELAISTNQTVTEIKALREDFKKADERIEELESKPAKRYETFITATITAICGGLIGYLVSLVLH
jgi:peptidoglycan hydrolase CwlO-like protein